MNRYGDTPLGMVESALEFLRIGESHGFKQMILSMKSSNPKVMIQAYRLLVERMQQEAMHYPLHLGVTEAGDGEDGRIKSAIGIGSLLLDGLGDTIRVSLTEDSVYEIPVARAIAGKAMSRWKPEEKKPANASSAASLAQPEDIDPYHFVRRETTTLAFAENCLVGPEQPPRVIVRASSLAALPATLRELSSLKLKDTPAEGLLVRIESIDDLAVLRTALAGGAVSAKFLALELSPTLTPANLESLLAGSAGRVLLVRQFSGTEGGMVREFAELVRRHRHFLACDLTSEALTGLASTLQTLGDDRLVFTLSGFRFPVSDSVHAIGSYRQLAAALRQIESRAPIWIRNTGATAVQPDP